VVFSIVSGPATLDGARLALTGTGTVVVQADQAGNATFAQASPVVRSFTVNKHYAPEIALSLPGGVAIAFKLVPAGKSNSVRPGRSRPLQTTIRAPRSSRPRSPTTSARRGDAGPSTGR